MKSIHKGVLLGAAGMFAALSLASSQSTVSQWMRVVIASPVDLAPVEVLPDPDPRDAVVIKEGSDFTVPAGKILVITACGNPSSTQYAGVTIDGVQEVRSYTDSSPTTVAPLPFGLTAQAGQVVKADPLTGSTGLARVWGYLVDA